MNIISMLTVEQQFSISLKHIKILNTIQEKLNICNKYNVYIGIWWFMNLDDKVKQKSIIV